MDQDPSPAAAAHAPRAAVVGPSALTAEERARHERAVEFARSGVRSAQLGPRVDPKARATARRALSTAAATQATAAATAAAVAAAGKALPDPDASPDPRGDPDEQVRRAGAGRGGAGRDGPERGGVARVGGAASGPRRSRRQVAGGGGRRDGPVACASATAAKIPLSADAAAALRRAAWRPVAPLWFWRSWTWPRPVAVEVELDGGPGRRRGSPRPGRACVRREATTLCVAAAGTASVSPPPTRTPWQCRGRDRSCCGRGRRGGARMSSTDVLTGPAAAVAFAAHGGGPCRGCGRGDRGRGGGGRTCSCRDFRCGRLRLWSGPRLRRCVRDGDCARSLLQLSDYIGREAPASDCEAIVARW